MNGRGPTTPGLGDFKNFKHLLIYHMNRIFDLKLSFGRGLFSGAFALRFFGIKRTGFHTDLQFFEWEVSLCKKNKLQELNQQLQHFFDSGSTYSTFDIIFWGCKTAGLSC